MSSLAQELQIHDLPPRIRQDVYSHVYANVDHEVGGVLVGTVDGRTGKPRVAGTIAALDAVGARASVTFTHDAWEAIIEQQEREFPSTQIVGWYHSHPDFGIFLSEHDIFIHHNFFPGVHQFAYVVDPVNHTEGVYGWRDGKVTVFAEAEVPAVDREGRLLEPGAGRVVIELDDEDDGTPSPVDGSAAAYAEASAATRGASAGARTRRVVDLDPEREDPPRRLGLVVAAVVALLVLGVGAVAVAGLGGGSGPTATSAKGNNNQGEAAAERRRVARVADQRRRDRAARQAAEQAMLSARQRTRWVPPSPKPSPKLSPTPTKTPSPSPAPSPSPSPKPSPKPSPTPTKTPPPPPSAPEGGPEVDEQKR